MEGFLKEKGYQILSSIGQGAFSRCYLVQSLKYQTNFVCKVIQTDQDSKTKKFQETYYAEIDALVHLDHPHIIKIYDHWHVDSKMVLVLEYCEHGSLNKKISRGKPIADLTLISYTKQLIEILFYCHSNMLSHHDIKPSNIFIDSYGRLKLGDFGLAHFGSVSKSIVGSLAYMAPEIFNRKPYDSFKADIWALGVTLYQIATGKLPFSAETHEELIPLVRKGEYEIPKHVPAIVASVIKQCLIVDPLERTTIQELDLFFKTAHSTHHLSNLPHLIKKPRMRTIKSSVSGLTLNTIKAQPRIKYIVKPATKQPAVTC